MSTQIVSTAEVTTLPLAGRLSDYVQLVRPKIAVMVLVTTLIGGLLAAQGKIDGLTLFLTVLGTGLVTAGASALNQLLEKRSDARMYRTENRPLPAKRLGSTEVMILGLATTLAGLAILAFLNTGPAAALVAATSFVLYVFAYTPAKRRTWLNTFIGAVPGALPPLIGWAGIRGTLNWEAMPLFLILFFWQVPHFMAIAWIYRDDYRRAGLKMLPNFDPTGVRTTWAMISHMMLLLAVSLLPLRFGAGWLFAVGAAALGLFFLAPMLKFARDHSVTTARQVLRLSLVYLPGVLILLLCDRFV
jgi:protoheme IX farnesyltransferase